MTTPDLSPEHELTPRRRKQLAALAAELDNVPDTPDWDERLIGRVPHLRIATWMWVVGYGWQETDPTPRGAAARIRWLLSHGLPEDWREQMSGEAPLCYREEASA